MKQSATNKETESDKESSSTVTTKREPQSSNQGREKRPFSEYEELTFQQGLPLKEDNKKSTYSENFSHE